MMLAHFAECGYAGPIRVLQGEDCRRFLQAADDRRRPPPLDWTKSCAATSRAFYEIGTHPALLDTVSTLLGGSVVLWGAAILDRAPGAVHPWHSDIETSGPVARTVSVWMGLEHTTRDTALSVIPYSHRLGVTVQELRQRHGKSRGDTSTEDIARWAQEHDRRCEVLRLEMTDGEAVFFDGHLWHFTHNLSASTRRAVLLQYAASDTAIRIPDFNLLDWPFRQFAAPRPACVLLRGDARPDVNRIVPAPAMASSRGGVRLSSGVWPVDVPLEPDLASGWKPYSLFRGSTGDIQDLSCHVSVLTQNSCPHPPHEHPEEEILLVLAGEVDVVLPQRADADGSIRKRLTPGQFVYYPVHFLHTLEGVSESPANYLMFKWLADSTQCAAPLAHGKFAAFDPPNDVQVQEGFCPRLLFEGHTGWLRKLHVHVSTLTPGAGYEPHLDSYDVALIVLEGEIETLGQRVRPHGVAFYAAGEPHDIHNPGQTTARYVVFEFHGSQRSLAEALPPLAAPTSLPVVEAPAPRVSEVVEPRSVPPAGLPISPPSFLTKLRDPQRWKRKLRQVWQRVREIRS